MAHNGHDLPTAGIVNYSPMPALEGIEIKAAEFPTENQRPIAVACFHADRLVS